MRVPVAFGLIVWAWSAQAADVTNDKNFQNDVRRRVERLGGNCPVPQSISAAGEDARGTLYRIECRSSDTLDRWTIRLITLPGRGDRRIELW